MTRKRYPRIILITEVSPDSAWRHDNLEGLVMEMKDDLAVDLTADYKYFIPEWLCPTGECLNLRGEPYHAGSISIRCKYEVLFWV